MTPCSGMLVVEPSVLYVLGWWWGGFGVGRERRTSL